MLHIKPAKEWILMYSAGFGWEKLETHYSEESALRNFKKWKTQCADLHWIIFEQKKRYSAIFRRGTKQ